MRYAALLALLPLPAAAWEFSPDPICTLSHQTDEASYEITYDQSIPEYALRIQLTGNTWDPAPSFHMSFAGGVPVDIATANHLLSDNRTTLTVRDRGFGNVLNGLEFNTVAVSLSGEVVTMASTQDAAPAVRAFRACPDETPATS